MVEITELLQHTLDNNGSDLHISSGHPPIVRVHGEMVPMKFDKLSPEAVKDILYSVMTEKQRAEFERDLEMDFSIEYGERCRFRVNAFNTIYGPAAVMRTIETEIKTLEELDLPDVLKRISTLHKGLALVTGPTGSGKSTTLAAMINYINTNMAKHVITIEDPVEFIHKSKKSLINQRELGSNTQSFAKALKSALREDPDVVLVGEMRDLETIQLALTAAETGHLVFGTLHTSSAPKTVDRIIDVFPAADKGLIRSMLSTSLEAVITQNLLKTADGKGRVAALEILIGNHAVRNLIREGNLPQIYSLMEVGGRHGMRTMKDSVYALLDEERISLDEAKSVLNMKSALEQQQEKDNEGDGGEPANNDTKELERIAKQKAAQREEEERRAAAANISQMPQQQQQQQQPQQPQQPPRPNPGYSTEEF